MLATVLVTITRSTDTIDSAACAAVATAGSNTTVRATAKPATTTAIV